MDQEPSSIVAIFNYVQSEILRDSEVDAPVSYLEESGPADPVKRTGYKWRKIEPPFSFTYENGSWVLFHSKQKLPTDPFKLDISQQGTCFVLSSDFSLPQPSPWEEESFDFKQATKEKTVSLYFWRTSKNSKTGFPLIFQIIFSHWERSFVICFCFRTLLADYNSLGRSDPKFCIFPPAFINDNFQEVMD